MSKNLVVSLLLKAQNMMSPAIEKAFRDAEKLKRSLSSLSGMRSPGNFFSRLNEGATVAVQRIEAVQRKLESLQSQGMRNIFEGAVTLSPAVATVKAAANFQEAKTNMEIATYDSTVSEKVRMERVEKLSALANKLGSDTKFDNIQAAQTITTLAKGGLDVDNIYNGAAKASMYLAQTADVDPNLSAEAIVKIGNSYQLQGNQFNQLADYIARLDGASTADVGSIMMGYKYAASQAKMMGVDYKQLGTAIAILNNRGLDNSTAGTNLADGLRRLSPETKKAYGYMKEIGLIDKSGHNVFFKDGKLKDLSEVIKIMREKTKKMDAEEKSEFYKTIFGVEGGRAMAQLTEGGKGGWEDVSSNVSKQMSLDQRIGRQQKDFNARLDELKGSWNTLLVTLGTPVLPWLTEKVKAMGDMVEKVQAWSAAHKDASKYILGTTAAIGALIAAVGIMKVGIGAAKFLFSPFRYGANMVKWGTSFFKKKDDENINASGSKSSTVRTNLMTVRATRVYINGPISQGRDMRNGRGGRARDNLGRNDKRRFTLNKPDKPHIPEKRSWKDRLLRRSPKPPATGLEEMGRMAKLARFAKGAGIVGTVAGAGIVGYEMYQQAKQTGWRQAVSQKGGALVGGAIGGVAFGALGSFLGPAGTIAGAAAGNWIGTKAGEWFDKGGYTKKAVDWALSMKDKLKNWWNSDEPKKASNDVKQMNSVAQQHTTATRQQMTQLTATAGYSATQTKTSLGSISTVTGQGKTWGTTLMSGLIASITAQFPGLRSAIAQLQSIMNISAPKVQMPTIQSPGIAAYASERKGLPTNSFIGVRLNANGNIINTPHWVGPNDIAGEAGPEAIIPLSPNRRSQGLYWMRRAAHYLGVSIVPGRVNYFANGGVLRTASAASSTAFGKGAESYYQQQFEWKDAIATASEVTNSALEQIKSFKRQASEMAAVFVKRANLPIGLTSEVLEVLGSANRKRALFKSIGAMATGSASAWIGGILGSIVAPGIGTVIGASLAGAGGSIMGRYIAEQNLKRRDESSKRRLVRTSSVGQHHDNRKINITIHAKDEKEAEQGVRKAMNIPSKYQTSRGAIRKPWEWGIHDE